MGPQTPEELKVSMNKYLMKLPIWDEVEKFGAELGMLEHEVKMSQERIQRISEEVDKLPSINTNNERIVLPEKQHLDHDIVKIYYRDESDEIIIKEIPQSVEPKSSDSPSEISGQASVAMLKLKPRTGDLVFARANETGPWVRCKIKCVLYRSVDGRPVTTFRLITCDGDRLVNVNKFEVARIQNHGDQLRASKRVVAGYSEETMNPGIVAHDPAPMFQYRYMVFLDNGECRYFKQNEVYPIFYQSEIPWKDARRTGPVDKLYLGELSQYFRLYPKRSIFNGRVGDEVNILRKDGELVPAIIIKRDCDVMTIAYKDRTEETIHRGCPRLTKTTAKICELLKNSLSFDSLFPKLVGNMSRYHEAGSMALGLDVFKFCETFSRNVTICGGTARKSTGSQPKLRKVKVELDEVIVAEDRDRLPPIDDLNAASSKHTCTPDCLSKAGVRTEVNVSDIIEEFRDVCDLKVPLRLGWQRIMIKDSRGKKRIVYQAPCGRICKDILSVRFYLQKTGSRFDVDYFTFEGGVIFNRPPGDQTAYYFEKNVAKGRNGECLENKFISCRNPHNEERLPADFEYRNDTFPHPMLKAKGFSFNTEFKSGCDCENDCSSRASCACHRLTEQAFGSTFYNRGQINPKCQYKSKRLLAQVSTGIFECNEFCKCSSKCPNRVVQRGIRVRMQIRKTLTKGWGVYVLDDVPRGSFICTYTAELLDDADQYGDCDMYFADLDYITLLENAKQDLDGADEQSDEGVLSDGEASDDDDLEARKAKSKSMKRVIQESSDSSDSSQLLVSDCAPQNKDRYPKRKAVVKKGTKREVATHTQPFRKIHSLLGETNDYTLDARMQGNVGRFFNHSCDPNSMVQNVFIGTHDLRFPVVAFFARHNLKAEDEITWDYNYQIGAIEGRVIICSCGSPNCKGRIL